MQLSILIDEYLQVLMNVLSLPITKIIQSLKVFLIKIVLFYKIVFFFLKILQTSEKQLARKLSEKGDRITREDIIYLLGDHLRTIEQLQVIL